MDYGQFSDDLAAYTDPTNPALTSHDDPDDPPDNVGHAEDPVPVCARCGSNCLGDAERGGPVPASPGEGGMRPGSRSVKSWATFQAVTNSPQAHARWPLRAPT